MPAPAPSAHRGCRGWLGRGCSWDGDPTAATAGRARPGAETGCGAGADSPQPSGRGQGFTHWLSPSSHLSCSRPQTLLQVSGRPPRGEGAPGGQGLCPSRPAAFQHQGHLHGPGAAPDARPAPAEVPELGPRPLRPLREQLQLSSPAPTQPGEQVAGPPLPLPDAQDNAQCLPSPREWSSVRLVGEPSWRHEWGTASFLIPEPAALPGWGVGAGALRAPSCDGRHLPPRGFGSGSGCEDAPPTSPLGQPERAAVSPQPRVGAHWGLGSDHPQDFSYDEPKVEFDVDAPSGVVMEGYLFKRASNAFKTWNR